ncbi:hypothetical protein A3Q56_00133 [Intoshia linei]|uniref:Uncharacterized protein n=1 Tax=Intoshia linei TaxID=1819745 RepID=A0A177BCR8_9BILA|nr:hypothetical protein A3Q56_00133 [Intoshia linei]
MVHCRAYILLKQEYEYLRRKNSNEINILPLNKDNYFEWYVRLYGSENTMWNIDIATGKMMITQSENTKGWNTINRKIEFLLKNIYNCLSIPDENFILNSAAYCLYKSNMIDYKNNIRNCVETSRTIKGAFDFRKQSIESSRKTSIHLSFKEMSNIAKIDERVIKPDKELYPVDFQEYADKWKTLATATPKTTRTFYFILNTIF